MSGNECEVITYGNSTEGVQSWQVKGFFDNWPTPPSPETHIRILKGSAKVVLAIDDETDHVVGFVTAVSDGVLSAYIPLLEVLESYRGQGIARELMGRMIAQLNGLYMIDLICDADLQPFYETLGLVRGSGMMIRNYPAQSGR